MEKEFLANLEKEVIANEPQEIPVKDSAGVIYERWKEVLDRSWVAGNTFVIDVRDLPDDLREQIEHEYDLVVSIMRKLNEDAEIRVKGCPQIRIHDMTQADVGHLRQVEGIIVGFDEDRRVKVLRDVWQCEEGHIVRSTGPSTFPRCNYMTPKMSTRGKKLPCGAALVRNIFSEQKRTDLFAVKIEEKDENPDIEASGIDIVFEGSELVRDVLTAIKSDNKKVRISGVVTLLGGRGGEGMTMCLDGNNIELIVESRITRYDSLVRREIPRERMRAHVMKLARSYAPHIAGRTELKMGLMAQAVGGNYHKIGTAKVRGELNIFILGSPATGKTQMLKYMEHIRPNSVYVSGRQASPIGLTAGASWGEIGIAGQSPRRRQVFMGAYALAQNGIVCLDELHKREKKDLEHLASVMDDNQEIVIAKSGLFRKIPVTCGTLAAGNPRISGGMYDRRIGLMEQIDNAYWLLSRFDLVYGLSTDDQRDKGASMRHTIAEAYRSSYAQRDVEQSDDPLTPAEERIILEGEFYPWEYIQAEVQYLRDNIKPILDVGSPQWDAMVEFWEKFSKTKMTNLPVDVFDPRKFNSVQRVSEAIAKLFRSTTVEMEHMQEAIALFRASMQTIISAPQADLGYVRFAKWLIEQNLDPCYNCGGKGCDICGSTGGHLIPVTYGECADYPYPEEARQAWDYMIAMGALVRMEDSLGGQSYKITEVTREMAQGGWRESEERDIAEDVLHMLRT